MKYFVFILGLTFLSHSTFSKEKLVDQDAFIFRVMDNVVSFKELQQDYILIQNLKCFYPESLLIVLFDKLVKDAEKLNISALTAKNVNFGSGQKELFQEFIKFYKLHSYVESHSVVLSPDLVTSLYAMAKKQKCEISGFENSKKFVPRMEQILKMEVFIRSRFLTSNGSNAKKIRQSVQLFLESVSKQVTEEVFW